MSKALEKMVLVLNKGWNPIHIKSVRDAICDVFSGCAEFIDTEKVQDRMEMTGMNTYDWNQWLNLPVYSGEECVQMVRGYIRRPLVIVHKTYNGIRSGDIKLTRRNIFLRDRFTCQYCGKQITLNTGTIDHIQPKSRGGKNSWDNFAASCKPCNTKKRNRTPEEAKLSRPNVGKPKWYPIAGRLTHKSPDFWNKFLPDSARLPEYSISDERR